MKNKTLKLTSMTMMLSIVTLVLAGCWTPPNANVQPGGEPRLIQSGIVVEIVQDPATVESVDATQRTISVKRTDGVTKTYTAGPNVKNFDQVRTGNQVKVTVTEELAVYLLANGRLLNGTTAETLGVNARVLMVDPSYRILKLQYPNGQSEAFKPGLGTRMEQMAPGDSVVVKPLAVTAIKIEKP